MSVRVLLAEDQSMVRGARSALLSLEEVIGVRCGAWLRWARIMS